MPFSGPATQTTKILRSESLKKILARDWASDAAREQLFQDAYRTLREVDGGDFAALLGHADPSVRGFGEKLARDRLDTRAADTLFRNVDRIDGKVQTLVFRGAAEAKPEIVIPQLTRLVTDGNAQTAGRALTVLGVLPARRAAGVFKRLLTHEKLQIRSQALLKVAESRDLLADRAVQRAVSEMADDEDERIRVKALETLVEVNPVAGIRACVQHVTDTSNQVQQTALRLIAVSLDRLEGSAQSDEAIVGLLIDGNDVVRDGVLSMLNKRREGAKYLRGLLVVCKNLTGWMRERTLESLHHQGAKVAAEAIRLMEDPDEHVRAMAVALAALFRAAPVVAALIGRLKDEDWLIRTLAAEALGHLGDATAVPALIDGVGDPESGLACIDALAALRDPSSLRAIAQRFVNPRPDVRMAVLDALRAFDDPRIAPLFEKAIEQDLSEDVRYRAASHLAEIRAGKGGPVDKIRARLLASVARPNADELLPLEKLLVKSRDEEASDVHVIVGNVPRVRVHGALQKAGEEPYTEQSSREAILPLLDAEQRAKLEEEHQLDFCYSISGAGRFRCNVYAERKGLAGSFRLIPKEVPTVADLGLPAHVADIVNFNQGLVVVAGPTGSGKSTTLAALVNLINERRRSHLLILEDPIEFVHPSRGCLVNQRQTVLHTRSFAAALRGALREDPDVIVVGDMRDVETVRLAIEASETGHLVIGTMNTTSAPKTIDRIIESFPPGEQAQIRTMLSETLRMIICQLLLPSVSEERVACFEILMGTLNVRTLIRESKTYQLVGQMQIGEKLGHVTVDVALMRLVEAGKITAEQAWLRARDKKTFQSLVSPEFLSGQKVVG